MSWGGNKANAAAQVKFPLNGCSSVQMLDHLFGQNNYGMNIIL